MIEYTKKDSIERYGHFNYDCRVTYDLGFPYKELNDVRRHDVCFYNVQSLPYSSLVSRITYYPFSDKVYDKRAANRFYKFLLYGKGCHLSRRTLIPSVKSIEWEGITLPLSHYSYPGLIALLGLFRYPVEYPDIVDITLHLVDELKIPFVHAFYLAHYIDHPQRLACNRASGHSFYPIGKRRGKYIMTDIGKFIQSLNSRVAKVNSTATGNSKKHVSFQNILVGGEDGEFPAPVSNLRNLAGIKEYYDKVKKFFITDSSKLVY